MNIKGNTLLNSIKQTLLCENLTVMIEDTENLVLDLGDGYVYFTLIKKNSKYRLTCNTFNNTMCVCSETKQVFKSYELAINKIIDKILIRNKKRGFTMIKKITIYTVKSVEDDKISRPFTTKRLAEDAKETLKVFGIEAKVEKETKTIEI